MAANNVPRRLFLTDGAKLAAGAGALGFLAGCQAPSAASAPPPPATAVPKSAAVPEWPWPYVRLDPQDVAQRAYASYYEAGCMYGAFNALIGALKEKVGFPYTVIPPQMVRYGEGGGVGWATLCGTLNGSAAVINLVSKDYSQFVNELFGWYTNTTFPMYKPVSPKVDISATSVSGSPLCHASVTEWCKAANAKSESPERSERCARLTADVAAQTAEMLNTYVASPTEFKASLKLAPSVSQCGACHLKGGTLENARGKMDCVSCHEPHSFPPAPKK